MSPRWVDTWARNMVMWYWSVAILFWQLSIDHIVKVQYKRFGFAKTRLRHPSLPFHSLPYPTRTTCRRVRSINHVTTKRKEVDHILWVWGSHARLSRVGAPLIIIIIIIIIITDWPRKTGALISKVLVMRFLGLFLVIFVVTLYYKLPPTQQISKS